MATLANDAIPHAKELLEEFLASVNERSMLGRLGAAWAKLGLSPEERGAQFAVLVRERLYSTVQAFIDAEVGREREGAHAVSRLFEQCFVLSQRLAEPIGHTAVRELAEAITISAAATDKETIVLVSSSSSAPRDAVAGQVFVPIPSFSIDSSYDNEAQGVTAPLPAYSDLAIMKLPHSRQEELLGQELRRLQALAAQRLEQLRIVAKLKEVTQMPVGRQQEARDQLAKGLFSGPSVQSSQLEGPFGSRRPSPMPSPRPSPNALQPRSNRASPGRMEADLEAQDLSLGRLEKVCMALYSSMQQDIRAIFEEIDAEAAAMKALWQLMAVPEETSEEFFIWLNGALSSVRDNGGIDDSWSGEALFRQYPSYLTRLFTIKSPASILAEVSAKRAALQEEYYDENLIKFTDTQREVARAYLEFYSITGDDRFADIPHHDAILPEGGSSAASRRSSQSAPSFQRRQVFGTCQSEPRLSSSVAEARQSLGVPPGSVASRDYGDFQGKLRQLKKATELYEKDLAAVNEQLGILRHIIPLIEQRDGIIYARREMQKSSRERLLSRSVNMAKQLFQEEKIRKQYAVELPRLQAQILTLCSQWQEHLGTPLVINGLSIDAICRTDIIIFGKDDPESTPVAEPAAKKPARLSPSRSLSPQSAPRNSPRLPISSTAQKRSREPLTHSDTNSRAYSTSQSPRKLPVHQTSLFPAAGTKFVPRKG